MLILSRYGFRATSICPTVDLTVSHRHLKRFRSFWFRNLTERFGARPWRCNLHGPFKRTVVPKLPKFPGRRWQWEQRVPREFRKAEPRVWWVADPSGLRNSTR